ncbi:MAG: HlyD family efflux transporter periplasmic adaptor subunit [Oscillospiraceae bacterium]|nr:HlyD family efflux transporter periplasmic adaptor subunit [Oscillospiraceae bacterium]
MSRVSKVIKMLLVAALSIFLLIFIIYQIYSSLYSPYTTETVSQLSHENKIQVEGIFLRSEETVNAAHQGYIVHYLYSDGQKVGAGGTVAELYASENDVLNYEKIKELKHRLEILEQSQDQSSALVTNADQITTQINSKIKELSMAVFRCDADAIADCKDDLQILLNRRNIITEKETDFNDYITQIKNEINSRNKSIRNALKTVKAEKNGNFVISTDGYESTAVFSSISQMSVSEIDEFIAHSKPQDVSQNTIGKLITDFTWYYTMILPIDDHEYNEKIKEGTTLRMRFTDVSEEPCNVVVSKVILDEANSQMAVIVRSEHMTGKFCSARLEKAEIIFSTAKGYKVKKSAVRFDEDGNKGVYVVIAQQMFFRKIDVIYEKDDYVICSATNGSGTLKPFDDVIVKGTDLYDGKNL